MIFVVLSSVTGCKELLLVDSNFTKKSLHQFIDQFGKSFVD
jgi:hypothetical protein